MVQGGGSKQDPKYEVQWQATGAISGMVSQQRHHIKDNVRLELAESVGNNECNPHKKSKIISLQYIQMPLTRSVSCSCWLPGLQTAAA